MKTALVIWVLPGMMAVVEARPIPPAYRLVGEAFGVPPALLYAVARTESRKQLTNGNSQPWPWTLNVEGEEKRYSTRIQAWSALKQYLKHGKTLIDIGVMQIAWHYHHQKLGTPWQALDPLHNLRVGAHILKNHYEQSGDWYRASGAYHSPGARPDRKRRAAHYRTLVVKQLQWING